MKMSKYALLKTYHNAYASVALQLPLRGRRRHHRLLPHNLRPRAHLRCSLHCLLGFRTRPIEPWSIKLRSSSPS